jgi:hypothetical protein
MKSKYDLSRGVRGYGLRGNRVESRRRHTSNKKQQLDDEPLTRAQIHRLRQSIADLRDTTRYLVVSAMGPGFTLYYNVLDDLYAMNDPTGGTLFKRRNAALAVKRLLGPKTRIIRCNMRRRNGVRVPDLPAGFGRRTTRRK